MCTTAQGKDQSIDLLLSSSIKLLTRFIVNHARSTGLWLCRCWQSFNWYFDYGFKDITWIKKNASSMCCQMFYDFLIFEKQCHFGTYPFIYLNYRAAPWVSTRPCSVLVTYSLCMGELWLILTCRCNVLTPRCELPYSVLRYHIPVYSFMQIKAHSHSDSSGEIAFYHDDLVDNPWTHSKSLSGRFGTLHCNSETRKNLYFM